MTKEPLLSAEMLATADALRQLRLRVCQLIEPVVHFMEAFSFEDGASALVYFS